MNPVQLNFFLGPIYSERCCHNSMNLPGGLPTALNTIFRIVLMGRICEVSSNTACSLLVKETSRIHLRTFWEIEEVDSTFHANPLELQCEDLFAKTHTRDDSGRYVVSLPFKENPVILGESKQGALVRFHKLENQFGKEPSLKENYDTVMREYLSKGYYLSCIAARLIFSPTSWSDQGQHIDQASHSIRCFFFYQPFVFKRQVIDWPEITTWCKKYTTSFSHIPDRSDCWYHADVPTDCKVSTWSYFPTFSI